MRYIPPDLLADLQAECTTLAYCWSITLGNGRVIRATEHDMDITIPARQDGDANAGLYVAKNSITVGDWQSASDLSVANAEVQGAFPEAHEDSPPNDIVAVTAQEIEDGLCDMAPVIILVCNWAQPSHGYFVAGGGTLGQATRDSDAAYTTEVRSLAQQLQQIIVRTFSETCNAEFGDGRCKFAIPAPLGGHVTAVTDRAGFSISIDSGSHTGLSFTAGKLTFTTGPNATLSRDVKTDPFGNSNAIEFWEGFPETVSINDEFELRAGCDLAKSTCKFYGNLDNFRGHGSFIPGVMALTAGPDTPQS